MPSVGDFPHELVPARTPDAPTLLLLHGTGGDEHDLLPLGRELAADAALLSPRGQVREGPLNRWFRRLAEGVFDTEDLIQRTHELADWLAVACEHHGIDPGRLVAVGFSNGANIAAAMLLLRPEALRAAVLLSPMLPLEDSAPVDLTATGVFVGAGRHDPMGPPEQVEQLAARLQRMGAAVELHWHDAGHGVDRATVTAAAEWLAKLRAAIAAGGGRSLP